MPILEVEIVIRSNETLRDGLAGELANCCGEIFGSRPGTTWVKLKTIARDNYAENGGGMPEAVLPVFVSVLKAGHPAPDALKLEADWLAHTVAQVCDRLPENVHIIYLPEGAGRVAFGGKIIAR